MSDPLSILIEKSRQVTMTSEQREMQRRSFAFGNANIENERVTRESIDKEAEVLASESDGKAKNQSG